LFRCQTVRGARESRRRRGNAIIGFFSAFFSRKIAAMPSGGWNRPPVRWARFPGTGSRRKNPMKTAAFGIFAVLQDFFH
jgi:hypothetical protein